MMRTHLQAVLTQRHEGVLQRLQRAEAALAATTRDYILGARARLSWHQPVSCVHSLVNVKAVLPQHEYNLASLPPMST